MSQIPIPLLGVTSTAAQFKFATSTDTSAGAVRIEYSGATQIPGVPGAGLFIRSTGATAYYPPAIILSNAAYGTESRITTASDNGILFQSLTPASWVFTASFSGAQSAARIKSTAAAVSDTGVLEIDTGYAAQAGIRVKLAATPTADAFQVYASDGTTKLWNVTAAGSLQWTGLSTIEENSGVGAFIVQAGTSQLRLLASNVYIRDVNTMLVDGNSTAGNTRLMIYDVDNATLERVSVGAADSGGAGYKVLRIPN